MPANLKVLIVDDEPLVRQGLAAALESQSVTIVGEARNGLEALDQIQTLAPDLVFLDVEMPELSGVEVVRELKGSPLPCIIFVTAFDKYAVQAFEHHAVDYLLKPFDEARVEVAVTRARERLGQREATAEKLDRLIEKLAERTPPPRFFTIRAGNRVVLIKRTDVEWMEAAGNYVRLYAGGAWQVIRQTMKELEGTLDPERFVRVHRSAIVNLERVAEFRPLPSGDFTVVMLSGGQVGMSRRFRKAVEQRLGQPLP